MSTLDVAGLTNQDVQLAKAWVNFNGQGTVAVRASYNVTSITDNGTADYTINFTNAMADADYVISGTVAENDQAGDGSRTLYVGAGTTYNGLTRTTTQAKVRTGWATTSYGDANHIMVVIHGN